MRALPIELRLRVEHELVRRLAVILASAARDAHFVFPLLCA
jgi:hypothetical protein